MFQPQRPNTPSPGFSLPLASYCPLSTPLTQPPGQPSAQEVQRLMHDLGHIKKSPACYLNYHHARTPLLQQWLPLSGRN
jgi:hypothetical protein